MNAGHNHIENGLAGLEKKLAADVSSHNHEPNLGGYGYGDVNRIIQAVLKGSC